MKRTLPVLLLGAAILASAQVRAAITDPIKTDAGQLSGITDMSSSFAMEQIKSTTQLPLSYTS